VWFLRPNLATTYGPSTSWQRPHNAGRRAPSPPKSRTLPKPSHPPRGQPQNGGQVAEPRYQRGCPAGAHGVEHLFSLPIYGEPKCRRGGTLTQQVLFCAPRSGVAHPLRRGARPVPGPAPPAAPRAGRRCASSAAPARGTRLAPVRGRAGPDLPATGAVPADASRPGKPRPPRPYTRLARIVCSHRSSSGSVAYRASTQFCRVAHCHTGYMAWPEATEATPP
jgi:hypothetical protein